MSDDAIPLDPIGPTAITPNLVAVPMAPTVWDDLADGQHAVTGNGYVWLRRGGIWYADPWWQGADGAEIFMVCADSDSWAWGAGWPRHILEDAYGPLTPITLPRRAEGAGDVTPTSLRHEAQRRDAAGYVHHASVRSLMRRLADHMEAMAAFGSGASDV